MGLFNQDIYAIILAGGTGERLGGILPKQLQDMNGKPLLHHTINTFVTYQNNLKIIIVSHERYVKEVHCIIDLIDYEHMLVIAGGRTRQESSYAALNALKYNDDDILLFHDAARPFVTHDQIERCIKMTIQHGAAALYVPVVDTIAEKNTNGTVGSVLDRTKLFCAQTPQSFRYSVIRNAHEAAFVSNATSASDDVSLVLQNNHQVYMIDGDYSNFKITTQQDFFLANIIARKNNH